MSSGASSTVPPYRLGSEHERNPGTDFHAVKFMDVSINESAVNQACSEYTRRRPVKGPAQTAWLLRVISCCDNTTLSGDDTEAKVDRVCWKSRFPVRRDILEELGIEPKITSPADCSCIRSKITTGAVCVYPARVAEAVKCLAGTGIPVAAVATGFPSGQIRQSEKLAEIRNAVKDGASEIDIVIPRDLALQGRWEEMYHVVKEFREACGEAHMKTILETFELDNLTNVYRASMVCMMAGADFIKTSTGKVKVNAVLPVGFVMVRAIRDYYAQTGYRVGFKPAGGISTAKVALQWMAMMLNELGEEYTRPDLFRYGCSSLIPDVERQLHASVFGQPVSLSGIAPS